MSEIIALGIIALVKAGIPEIEALMNKGVVLTEEQQRVLNAFLDLRDHLNEKFAGAEWQIDPDPKPATPTVVVNVNPPVK
jgi:hypothetical protein